ncbi:MAG: hypothetical protein ACREMP_04565 [Candidatus Tyrphobacter sp.]
MMSSKRRIRRGEERRRTQACTRKKAYATEQQAWDEVRRAEDRGVSLHAYACPFEMHFHIGHSQDPTS